MRTTPKISATSKSILLTVGVSDFTGASRMSFRFARALSHAGHRVVAAVGPRPPDNMPSIIEPLRAEGIAVFELSGFEPLLDLRFVRQMATLIGEESIDCVLTSQLLDAKIATWAARLAGVPCVVHAQGMAEFRGNWLLRRCKWWGYRATLAGARPDIVCVSNLVHKQYLSKLGVHPARTSIVENGIDVGLYANTSPDARQRVRTELGIGDDELVLINIGRLDRYKAQDKLLEALLLAKLHQRPVRLLLVGGESADNLVESRQYIADMHRIVAENQLESKVIFTGWREDIAELLRAADGYVLSSRFEGFPLVLLEAMAAGLPVVSMDSVPTPCGFEHLTHGYLVQGADPAALAAGLRWLADQSAADRQQVGRRGFELVVEHHDIAMIEARFVAKIETIIDRNRPRPAELDSPLSADAPAAEACEPANS